MYIKKYEEEIDKSLKGFDRVQDGHEEQEFWMTILDWVRIRLNQFEMFEEHENYLSRWKKNSSWKQCWIKTMYK